jgi:hypothetical protein
VLFAVKFKLMFERDVGEGIRNEGQLRLQEGSDDGSIRFREVQSLAVE